MLKYRPISSCCTFKSCSMASLSALMVSTCSISFLNSCTAGLEDDDDDAAPTFGIAAVNSACKQKKSVTTMNLILYAFPTKKSTRESLTTLSQLPLLKTPSGPRVSVSPTSVTYFCPGFSCYPYFRGVVCPQGEICL